MADTGYMGTLALGLTNEEALRVQAGVQVQAMMWEDQSGVAIREKYEKEMEEARTNPNSGQNPGRPTIRAGDRAIMPRFGEHASVLAVEMLDGRTQASVVTDEGQFVVVSDSELRGDGGVQMNEGVNY